MSSGAQGLGSLVGGELRSSVGGSLVVWSYIGGLELSRRHLGRRELIVGLALSRRELGGRELDSSGDVSSGREPSGRELLAI